MKPPAKKHRRIPRELRTDELTRAAGGGNDDPHGHFAMSRPDVVEDSST